MQKLYSQMFVNRDDDDSRESLHNSESGVSSHLNPSENKPKRSCQASRSEAGAELGALRVPGPQQLDSSQILRP